MIDFIINLNAAQDVPGRPLVGGPTTILYYRIPNMIQLTHI